MYGHAENNTWILVIPKFILVMNLNFNDKFVEAIYKAGINLFIINIIMCLIKNKF